MNKPVEALRGFHRPSVVLYDLKRIFGRTFPDFTGKVRPKAIS